MYFLPSSTWVHDFKIKTEALRGSRVQSCHPAWLQIQLGNYYQRLQSMALHWQLLTSPTMIYCRFMNIQTLDTSLTYSEVFKLLKNSKDMLGVPNLSEALSLSLSLSLSD
jgi:hypothetical protein